LEHYFVEAPKSKFGLGILRTRLRGLGFEFLTASSTFSHRRIDPGTRLLIESMILPEEGNVLDIGCGYGPIGIAAAKMKPRVFVHMTDVNRRALALAEENAKRNGVRNVRIAEGPLYEPVSGLLFDVILSNPPITAGIRKVVAPLIQGTVEHLKKGGSLQLVVRTTKGGENILKIIEETFQRWEIVARGGGYRVFEARL
jgi:16S rRNA (guanine1207-N2)-methyltransferase